MRDIIRAVTKERLWFRLYGEDFGCTPKKAHISVVFCVKKNIYDVEYDGVKSERCVLTNASTPTTPLSQFVPFAALSCAQIAPIATRPVLRVKLMLG